MFTLLSLPDHAIEFILNQLNQKYKLAVMLMNKELYKRAAKSLYKRIYVNARTAISINTSVCNNFNSNFTIINCYKNLDELFLRSQHLIPLVKIIMFENRLELLAFRNKYGHFRIPSGSTCICNIRDIRDIGIAKHIYYPSPGVLHSDNYTTTRLTINLLPEITQHDFQFIPYLKVLTGVCIILKQGSNLRALSSRFENPLNIRSMRLLFDSFNFLEFECLDDVFNLTDITTLKLDIFKVLEVRATQISQFQWLFDHLPNLNHLQVILSKTRPISKIVSMVKKNSLHSLTVGSYNTPPRIKKMLSQQQLTIQNLSCIIQYKSITNTGFDWIFKCAKNDRSKTRTYERYIKELLGNNTEKYPILNCIIIGSLYYEVKRSEDGFHINFANYY